MCCHLLMRGKMSSPRQSKEDGRAARARALAISEALNASTPIRKPASNGITSLAVKQDGDPRRSESPRIPDGGIDAVASRASTHYRSAASKLELEAHVPNGTEFSGFGSARGIKRHYHGEEQQE